jgi:ABC-2 type transport system permease protein
MSKVLLICRRELASYFNSLGAYIMIVLFLAVTGFFTWLSPQNLFYQGQTSLGWFFYIAYWVMLFFIPAITMRSVSEENRTGTFELLITKVVSEAQIVIGKFLAAYLLIIIVLLLTLPYYITVARLGNIDHAIVLGGYLGLLLVAACYTSLGVFISSLTSNQLVAFLLSLVVAMLFHFIVGFVAGSLSGTAGTILNYFSMQNHFDSISRGLLDTRDIIYFLSFVALSFAGAQIILYRRNWTEK